MTVSIHFCICQALAYPHKSHLCQGPVSKIFLAYASVWVWWFLRELDIALPEDPDIPLLGMYPKDAPTCNKDICSIMFIAALFIIARSWKEPRCPSTKEWIQKMWYIYTMEY